jgi:hypothetical protein
LAPATPGILFNTPRTVATQPPQAGAVSRTSWMSVVFTAGCIKLQPANNNMSAAALGMAILFMVRFRWGKCELGRRTDQKVAQHRAGQMDLLVLLLT